MKIVFIGERDRVLRKILKMNLRLVGAFVGQNSFAQRFLSEISIDYSVLTEDRETIFERITQMDFDILVSNGCPFIIPVGKLRKDNQLFINIHPSFLPYYKGMHPINGVLLYGERFTGVTCHFMDDRIDAGNIIHQQKIDLTKDIDLELLYQLCFDLEARVFEKAYRILARSNFRYEGKPQMRVNSYYTRKTGDMVVAFSEMDTGKIYNVLRAFSSPALGAIASYEGNEIRLFDGEIVRNRYLNDRFRRHSEGEILMVYSNKLLIKTLDGMIKVNKYESKVDLKTGTRLR